MILDIYDQNKFDLNRLYLGAKSYLNLLLFFILANFFVSKFIYILDIETMFVRIIGLAIFIYIGLRFFFVLFLIIDHKKGIVRSLKESYISYKYILYTGYAYLYLLLVV